MKQSCIHGVRFCIILACGLLLTGCADTSDVRVTAGNSPGETALAVPVSSQATLNDDADVRPDAPEQLALAASSDTVKVRGTVTYDGKAPERRKIDVTRDKDCRKLHAEKPLLDEDILVNDDGQVQNAFVYIKHTFREKFPLPEAPAVIDQKNCMYTPRVQGIRAGQTLEIVNSDNTTHNVRSFPTRNRPFNLGQIGVGTREKVFKRPEREVVEFRCDIHRWMLAWVFVLDHPFYNATAEDGSYHIADLPDGEYTLVAWHEEFGEQKQKIKVDGDSAIEVNFTFPALEE